MNYHCFGNISIHYKNIVGSLKIHGLIRKSMDRSVKYVQEDIDDNERVEGGRFMKCSK